MSIAVDIIAAIARLLLRKGEVRDAAQNQDANCKAVALAAEVRRLMSVRIGSSR
jgi:hypothetical protein